MNKIELVKEIYRYLDSQDIIYANTIYEKYERRLKVKSNTANLRTITDGEIVVEFDTDNSIKSHVIVRRVIRKLKANGYSFVVWKAEGQRSPHINIYDIKGLDSVARDVNRMYKNLWFKKYATWDESDYKINTKSSQLLAMENRPHFKYGSEKSLLYSHTPNDNISNIIELDLLKEAKRRVDNYKDKQKEARPKKYYDTEWFIDWVIDEKLPRGERHSVIMKTLGIVLLEYPDRVHEVITKLEKMYDKSVGRQIKGWMSWAEQEKEFLVYEIMRYCSNNGYDFYEVKDRYSKNGKSKNSGAVSEFRRIIRRKF